ncbi:MAG: tyrosine-type recombinase/integrase [Candidatus Parvarchaeota archaeon]
MNNDLDVKNTQLSNISLIDRFMEFMHLENDAISPDTLRTYINSIEHFFDYCKAYNLNPLSLSEQDFQHYRNLLLKEHKPSSVQVYMSAIKRFYDMAVENHIIPVNNAHHVKITKFTEEQKNIKFLSKADVQRLFDAIDDPDPKYRLRNKSIIALMVLGGARTVEISNMKFGDLIYSIDQKVLTGIRVQAKRHIRVIPLRADVSMLLSKYINLVFANPKATDYLFFALERHNNKNLDRRSIRRIVDTYLKKIGVKRVGLSAHALRHTAATYAYNETKDINQVQKFLGHTNPSTTSIYVHTLKQNNPLENFDVDIHIDDIAGGNN